MHGLINANSLNYGTIFHFSAPTFDMLA